ncbi:hypothetical protein CDAR_98621 [Caerostris darwini]|uniref:Uncharacterized protein n=1 Tax=Caerostris darwini TaxID=1538125 RepID=A0AAV4WWZ5_9ARAC|nr:hypothetical protein CDAR_98621 [Caerostris darwini]
MFPLGNTIYRGFPLHPQLPSTDGIYEVSTCARNSVLVQSCWCVFSVQFIPVLHSAGPYLADVAGPGSFFLHAGRNQVNSHLASVFEIHHDLKVESAIVFLATAAARCRSTRLAETARLTGGRTDRT